MIELSILIPARNEMFLAKTVENILENSGESTEIIAVLDGVEAKPPIPDHPRVTSLYHQESIGQRAATNDAARLARGKYVMKLDAHCAVDKGFDRIMIDGMHDDWTMVPIMRNLHAFDWVCKKCGHRRYQGRTPTECPECDNTTDFERDILWIGKSNPQSKSYCFDPEPHFQYFREFSKRPEGQGDITPTMGLQGSCFMLTLKKYWELGICDEAFGGWGSQGIEVAARTWLTGGSVMVNHKTWYAHMFRTQGGDFSFPYSLSQNKVNRAKRHAHKIFFENTIPGQVRPLSWLVEKFWPVYGWTDEDLATLKKAESPSHDTKDASPKTASIKPVKTADGKPTKGIVYYTDNRPDPAIMKACQKQLEKSGLPIVSVSLKPMKFGNQNIVLDLERGNLTMFKQILAGLEASTADIIFFTEHDVLYDQSHFKFDPPLHNVFYYNQNAWRVDAESGHALFHYSSATSGLCAYRELLLEHYRKRVQMVEESGFSRRMGYEPGTNRRKERVDDHTSEVWMSELPNIDIRHGKNLTRSRWSKDQFRNQKYTKGWKESNEVPGWGITEGKFTELLNGLSE